MLPNYPIISRKITKFCIEKLEEERDFRAYPFSKAKKDLLHEGSRSAIIREDGSIEEFDFKKIEVGFTIDEKEIGTLTINEVLNKMSQMSKEMAKQFVEYFVETIDEAVKKVGNVVNSEGKKITTEKVFEMIEKICIDFDEFGKPEFPTFVGNKSGVESIKNALLEIEKNKELDKKFKDLLERKKRQYLDREANRKLVG
jgi:hypothetical protein